MKLKRMRRSILQNVHLALLGSTVITIILLWLFQIVFLNTYYESMQKRAVVSAGENIAHNINTPDFNSYLEHVCYDTNMSAIVFSSDGVQITFSDMLGGRSFFSSAREQMTRVLENMSPLFNGEKSSLLHTVEQTGRDTMILYGKRVTNSHGEDIVIVLNAPLQPVGNTAGILKSQMAIIAAILFLFALVISQVLSRRLVTPIRAINDKAKRLANGDYTADYSGEGLAEIDELAQTLNFSANGLSKVEELRRELVANVSHDLKTPLTMIQAYAEMIRDITGDDKEKRDEQLGVIIDETGRLSALVNDLIRVSRDESANREINPECFDIQELIEETVSRFAAGYGEYEFVCEYADRNMVIADKPATAQVVYNLISNAVNYTGEDRRVIIRTLLGKTGLRVEIRDTGKGIPSDELPLIWERYYRSENTHQRPVAGSGLGLSIVRGALEAQKLPYGVESFVGYGSCFWFEAPIADVMSQDAE